VLLLARVRPHPDLQGEEEGEKSTKREYHDPGWFRLLTRKLSDQAAPSVLSRLLQK
jgi:hypothetical protein